MARALALCTIAAANQRRPNEGLGPGSGKGWEAGECFGTARCEAEADGQRRGRAGRQAGRRQLKPDSTERETSWHLRALVSRVLQSDCAEPRWGWRLEEELARRMALCSRGEGSLGLGSLGRSGPSSNLGLGLARTQKPAPWVELGWKPKWKCSLFGWSGWSGGFLALETRQPAPCPSPSPSKPTAKLHAARCTLQEPNTTKAADTAEWDNPVSE